ncbi:lysophospholipid acyltransferase family protein [Sphingobacterium bambusae]|uniref:Lipid A biosynthesis acyltransferase n=1 Tax=Sphingobacterium bambusae TaxID=662858 RepID=A0ABW6BAB7_9SPHI|nr:hypothetical protein [Sphingobacterium bambusae]WPL48480.1 hypothetical protein SCB77_21255 [Sphingobacterium bambusae]
MIDNQNNKLANTSSEITSCSKEIAAVNTYSFFSANLLNFIPSIPFDLHPYLFKEFRKNKKRNGIDATSFSAVYPYPIVGWETIDKMMLNGASILCTFHFGPFQLLNYVLVKQEEAYCLLVARETYDKWRERYPNLIKLLCQAQAKGLFDLINVNDRNALRTMYRQTAEGRKLLIYVDGLEGMSNERQSSLQKINFLGQIITVPSGAAQLSWSLKLPLQPVIAEQIGDTVNLRFGKAIYPNGGVNRDLYLHMTMQSLFSFVSYYIMRRPELWTNWPSAHLYLGSKPPIEDSIFDELSAANLHARKFGLFSSGEQYFLLRKKDYLSFVITGLEFSQLLEDPHFSGVVDNTPSV